MSQLDEYRWNARNRVWTRFDGKQFSRAVLTADLEALSDPTTLDSHPAASAELRSRALSQSIEGRLLDGANLMQRNDYDAILSEKKPMSHGTHVVLCVLTLGLWLTPYLIMAVLRKDLRYRLEVDRWGHVWARTSS